MGDENSTAVAPERTKPEVPKLKEHEIPPKIPVIALLEGSERLIGLLDSDKKKFMILPGAESPIGPLGTLCEHPSQHNSILPSVYLDPAQGNSDYNVMNKKVKSLIGEKNTDYIVVRMYYKVKFDRVR